MKNINKFLFAGLLFLVCGLSSCDTDNEGTFYSKGSGSSLLWSKSEIVVGPDDTSFEVRVTRSTTSGAETLDISSTGDPIFTVPASITFENGESFGFIKVSFPALEFDKTYDLSVSIPDDKVSVSGIASAKLTISKDYDWISLGKGKFADYWALGKEYDVEILKADGYDRYRVLKPYVEGHKNDDGEWEDWLAGDGPDYIEFWEIGEGLIQFKSYAMDLNYEADKDQPIFCWYPTDLGNLPINYNKKINDKTYQFAPYYYIDGVGGWNFTTTDGVIIITLP